jgi:hypothetical protein
MRPAWTGSRYLSDHIKELPLGVATRLVGTQDTIMALAALIHAPPWVRRRDKATERYSGGQWRTVDQTDRLAVGQQEAQVQENQ